jgi:hypothetical protein
MSSLVSLVSAVQASSLVALFSVAGLQTPSQAQPETLIASIDLYSACFEQAKKALSFSSDITEICRNPTIGSAACIEQANKALRFNTDIVAVCRNATPNAGQCIEQTSKVSSFSTKIVETCRNSGSREYASSHSSGYWPTPKLNQPSSSLRAECMEQANKALSFKSDRDEICRNPTIGSAFCLEQAKKALSFSSDIVAVCRNAAANSGHCIEKARRVSPFASDIVKTCKNS